MSFEMTSNNNQRRGSQSRGPQINNNSLGSLQTKTLSKLRK